MTMRVHFKDAVRQLITGHHTYDPAEPCAAYRVDDPKKNLSELWQFVADKPNTTPRIEKVHFIVTETDAASIESSLQDEYPSLRYVGQTYNLPPYSVGIASLGKNDKTFIHAHAKEFQKPGVFKNYLSNWLETHEGYQDFCAVLESDSPEYMHAYYHAREGKLTRERKKEYIDQVCFARSEDAQKSLMYHHQAMFVNAVKAIPKDALNQYREEFYMMTAQDTDALLRKNAMVVRDSGCNLLRSHQIYVE